MRVILTNLIILLVLGVDGCLGMEIYFHKKVQLASSMTDLDPETAFKTLPGVNVRAFSPDDFQVTYHANSRGHRGISEQPFQKEKGNKKILGLGDSFTFGVGVEDNETYLAIMETELRDSLPGMQTINGGVAGCQNIFAPNS